MAFCYAFKQNEKIKFELDLYLFLVFTHRKKKIYSQILT